MATDTKALVVKPQQPTDFTIFQLAQELYRSGYFADVKSASQAYVKVLAGQEIGIGPLASIREINIIRGRPTFSATLMASLIKASDKYNYKVKRLDDAGCKIEFFEDGQLAGESEFTYENAKTAGLVDKLESLWPKYKRNMCFARAMSNGAKWFCSEVFNGITPYTAEELRENPNVIDVEALPVEESAHPIDTETGKVADAPAKEAATAATDKKPGADDLLTQYGGYLKTLMQNFKVYVPPPDEKTIEAWIKAIHQTLTKQKIAHLLYNEWLADHQQQTEAAKEQTNVG